MTIKKLLFNTSGWSKIEYWTTLEKDASVTDWQLNDMISFQKETIFIPLSLIVQSFYCFFAVKVTVQIAYFKNKIFGHRIRISVTSMLVTIRH